MKRSEFKEKWKQLRPGHMFAYELQLATAAAEAAGVTWDPEEEPLPKRLEARVEATSLELFVDDVWCGGNAIVFDNDFERAIPLPQRGRVLKEAVRRYNAWPELRKALEIARGHEGNYIHSLEWLDREISRILDGQ